MPRLPRRLGPQPVTPGSPVTRRVLTDVVPDSEPIRSSPAKHEEPSDAESEEDERPRKRTKVAAKSRANLVVDDNDGEDTDNHQPLATSRPSPPKTRRRQESEVQSDSDDDTPLAANVPVKSRKGKEVVRPPKAAEEMPNDAAVTKEGRTRAGKSAARGKAKDVVPTVPKTRPGRSWETGVVPSSLPDQDHPPPLPKAGRGTSVAQPTRSRPRRRAASNKTYQESSDDDDDELPAANARGRSPSTRAEDRATGEAEDDDHNGMELDEPEAGPSTSARKRKRGYGARAPVKVEKNAATRLKSTPNRAWSTAASSRSDDQPSIRVFALWSPTKSFYPGVVDYVDDKNQLYSVKFDDGQQAQVTINDIRLVKHLRQGDEIQVLDSSILYRFVGLDEVTEAVTVTDDEDEREVMLSHIILPGKTVKNQWKDRIPTKKMLVARPRSAALPRPTALFENTTFIISISAAKTVTDVRESLTNLIKVNGGSVAEMLDIFEMVGATTKRSKRWIIRKGDVRYKAKADQIFLVADEATPKPKYLMALALGIPCLEKEWVDKSVEAGELQDWRKYLLPQGTCEETQVRLSQQVNLDWCKNKQDLEDIMDSFAPNKVFAGASVLCYGDDMNPKTSSSTSDNRNYPARIILCMGADIVEVVPDFAAASNKNLTSYTYIVASTITNEIKHKVGGHPQLVDWKWVKSCLLSSRLLDIPSLS
ncbi:hypothetical protein H1R20_g4204, partial [Candolleomyces eurysporus]